MNFILTFYNYIFQLVLSPLGFDWTIIYYIKPMWEYYSKNKIKNISQTFPPCDEEIVYEITAILHCFLVAMDIIDSSIDGQNYRQKFEIGTSLQDMR